MVIAHNKAQLAAIETVRVVHGDIRQPEAVLADPAIRGLIDFSQPVGLLMVAVLHFITDDEDPGRIVAAFTRELAPGSYLALSHISSDGTSPEAITTIRDATPTPPLQRSSAPQRRSVLLRRLRVGTTRPDRRRRLVPLLQGVHGQPEPCRSWAVSAARTYRDCHASIPDPDSTATTRGGPGPG